MAQGESGVLPTQRLRTLFEAGFISGIQSFEEYLNPASIDLPLSSEAYRIESIFMPRHGERVRDRIADVGGERHDLRFPLEVGVPYLILIEGKWKLPKSIYGYVNPKSSVGRLNLFSRIVADGVKMYDALLGKSDCGWEGEMWMLVRADSFPVLLHAGKSVSQVRLFNGKSFLSSFDMDCAIEKYGLLFDEKGDRIPEHLINRHTESMLLTLEVGDRMGWECRGKQRPLDFSKQKFYEPADFFEPMRVGGDRVTLRKGGFYILSTRERVMVPPSLSAELRPIDVRLGEFRSHAAGYIDPGWGYGTDGTECGRPITLEVIPHEDMLVCDGQTVARIRYERMMEEPEVPYDSAKSNYVHQKGAQLSKHFK